VADAVGIIILCQTPGKGGGAEVVVEVQVIS
jgi:hypothetical protein